MLFQHHIRKPNTTQPRRRAARLAVRLAFVPGALCVLNAQAQDSAVTATNTATASAVSQLPAVEVVGRRQSGGYQADEVSGTKTALPLRELPQSVRVMSRQAIDDLGAVRLDDVLDYVGGISRQNNFGGLWDNVAIRGLAGNENTGMSLLLNGFAGNRGFNAPRDTANIERIEFLKGPAAALYGASEPGGTLNVVTKKPQRRAGHSVEVYAGSFDSYRASLDSTGPAGTSDDAALAYRLNLAVEKRGSFRDTVNSKRSVFAPALNWRVGPDTTLDYSGEWLRHETPLDRGVVAVNNQLGVVPRERFLGEPADANVRVDNQTHQLTLDHAWTPEWQGRVGLSYRTGSLFGFSTEPTALQADGRTLRRQRRLRDYGSDDLALQAELTGRVQTHGLKHDVVVGVETFRFTLDQRMLRINPSAAAPYAIDILAPVYGQTQPTPGPNTDTSETQRNTALYLQDALTVSPRWRVVGGVRLDRFEQALDNRRSGVRTEQSPSATSPRFGVSFLPDAAWTLYANVGRSFRANAGVDAAGAPFAPESGTATELGAKWERADKRLGATVALFDIRKRNALTGDPANAGFSVAAGELRSRGVEFDMAGQVTTQWRVSASLAYNDVKVLRDSSLEVGGRLLNTPRVNGSVLAVYESVYEAASGATSTSANRYGVGAGLTHMGARLGHARTQAEANAGATVFELPAYTTVKAVAYWRLGPALRVSLDVDNLFDTDHYTSSFSRVWVTPGSPRSLTLGLPSCGGETSRALFNAIERALS
jgi:iron complex outermembrane recepter protein